MTHASYGLTAFGPPAEPWPPDHLEYVRDCPVCGSDQRALRHEGLRDETFFTAAGKWDLWQCSQCRSGWLDPRPDQASIGAAYGTYYTHADAAPPPGTGIGQRLKRALSNDYRWWRYGSRRPNRLFGGRWLGQLVPALAKNVDLEMRYLPRPARRGARLLDVGCGNGAFLGLAGEAGWSCYGVEPDEKAGAIANKRGVAVRPFLKDWQSTGITFDAMTFNHSIEHVHDPVGTLAMAHSLLTPGGFLYLETPNMTAVGHDLYQRNWRGLETPRHLVLFSHSGLAAVLSECGFSSIAVRDRPSPLIPMADMSRRQAAGMDPYADAPPPPRPGPPEPDAIALEQSDVERREFITLTARKSLT